MPRGWFSGPGIGVLNGIFLRLDCTNDPLTAGLEVNAATAGEPGLILQSTDDNATNPLLEIQSSAAAVLAEWQTRGGLNFAAAVGQATPGLIGLAGTRFLYTYGTSNLFLGVGAGNFTLTGTHNFGAGENALTALTSGYDNLALGPAALDSNTTGYRNIAIGRNALTANISGHSHIAIGYGALAITQAGGSDIGIGRGALNANTTGEFNTAVGTYALLRNTIAHYNTALGGYTLAFNTTGSTNVAIGTYSMYDNTIGNYNVGIGRATLFDNVSGSYNVAVGMWSIFFNTTGSNNVAIGRETGYGAVGASDISGNILIGYRAGYSLLTGGDNNFLIGYEAGFSLTTGTLNVFLGYQAARAETVNSNRLYIANSNTATPLIYGEFNTWRLGLGNQYAVNKYGQLTHASGQFAAVGDAQDSRYVCRLAQASHAVNTWYPLFPDGGTAPERLTIAAETGWTIHVIIIGITAAATQQWGYEIIGLLERDGAGNTTLAGQTVRTIFESDANYDAQLAADNANEALEVQVRRTGGVDYDVRWTASMKVVETTYPA